MCGIVGYIGNKHAVPILLEGLHRLEYRGYDSAGIAVIEGGELCRVRMQGKVNSLALQLAERPFESTIGMGHTRWATHGKPSEANAHPHANGDATIMVVHNGIIENYQTLREQLSARGYRFSSETDTEVVAHLIEDEYTGDLTQAVKRALRKVTGTYGLVVMHAHHPREMVAARRGSPMVLGVGDNEMLLASDVAAFLRLTDRVVYLEDDDIVTLKANTYVIDTLADKPVARETERIEWQAEAVELNGFPHYMLKEIMEQPQTIADSLRGRLLPDEGIARLGGLRHEIDSLLHARRIIITACGTSWHSGLIGEYMLEEFVRTPVEVDYASEFRYRDPVLDHDTVVIAVSQSGETADTMAAVREARQKGCKVYGICNVVGSSIARESDAGVYLHCGPEIGVASTKAFTSQVTVLALMTLFLARMKSMSAVKGREMVKELQAIPNKVAQILQTSESIKSIAEQYLYCRNFLYLGRGYNFPVALEGALKLKEVSYIHAEGYPAAEMKHGPIALIDESMPVVFIAIQDSTYEKVLNNIAEVRARQGRVIAVATQGDKEIRHCVDHVIYVPPTLECLTPILTIIPLQLLAYHMAVIRGCDVDQPRNLAKSVTVE